MGAAPLPRVQVVSTAHWCPPQVVTNDDLSRLVDTSDEWIRARTGIIERRRADENTGAADMGAEAAKIALERAGATAADVDILLVSTATPDRLLPSTACDIQALIGAANAAAYDFATACSGFLYGLQIAEGHILAGHAKTVLLVCTEKMSAIIDQSDRATCVLFGDGAAAVVIRKADDSGRGLISSYMKTDGRLAGILHRPAGGARTPLTAEGISAGAQFVKMNGPGVFKHAVEAMCEAASAAMGRAGVSAADIDLMVPHQANLRIIEATARHARIPMDKVLIGMDRHGNMSSASIPVALAQAIEAGRVGEGSLVLMVAAGAGLTWAANVVRL